MLTTAMSAPFGFQPAQTVTCHIAFHLSTGPPGFAQILFKSLLPRKKGQEHHPTDWIPSFSSILLLGCCALLKNHALFCYHILALCLELDYFLQRNPAHGMRDPLHSLSSGIGTSLCGTYSWCLVFDLLLAYVALLEECNSPNVHSYTFMPPSTF